MGHSFACSVPVTLFHFLIYFHGFCNASRFLDDVRCLHRCPNKEAQDGAKIAQDGTKTCQDGAKTGLDGAKMGNMAERAQLASERSERCERSAADAPSFQGLF